MPTRRGVVIDPEADRSGMPGLAEGITARKWEIIHRPIAGKNAVVGVPKASSVAGTACLLLDIAQAGIACQSLCLLCTPRNQVDDAVDRIAAPERGTGPTDDFYAVDILQHLL